MKYVSLKNVYLHFTIPLLRYWYITLVNYKSYLQIIQQYTITKNLLKILEIYFFSISFI